MPALQTGGALLRVSVQPCSRRSRTAGTKSYWTNAGGMTEAEFETAIADIPREGQH